jgi:hypothetical protein
MLRLAAAILDHVASVVVAFDHDGNDGCFEESLLFICLAYLCLASSSR